MASSKLTQVLGNYEKAFAALNKAQASPVTEERDLGGIIKAFEIVYELAWKALKLALLEQGQDTSGPKDVFGKGFILGFLSDEKIWLKIIEDRNLTVHTYNQPLAEQMVARIKGSYLRAFADLKVKLAKSA